MRLAALPLLGVLAFAPVALASAPVAAPAPGTLCDQLAGNPDDPDVPAPATGSKGISWTDIDPEKAEPACRQAIAENPGERRYVADLARAVWKRGNAMQAFALFKQAADKGSAIAVNAMGLMYEGGEGVARDYAKALELYQLAGDRGLVLSWANIAALYARDKIPGKTAADARALYQKAGAAGDDWSMLQLAILHETGRGGPVDLKRAEALFRQVLNSPATDVAAEAKNDLAWMMVAYGVGDLVEAEALATQAIAQVRFEEEGLRASYHDTRAFILQKTGRSQLALADAQTAVGLGLQSAAVVDRLGDIYLALGRKAEARSAWEKALSLPAPDKADEPQFNVDAIRRKIASISGT